MAADVIVVGGGSAGCVLASRLTEDDERSVVLLEAGPDHPVAADLPADVADASEPTLEHDWGFVAEPDSLGRAIELPRGRIMGGCSATNGCFAVRGAPADYDRWESLGNPGWSFAEVLPYFRRLEADADFDDEWHGVDGPVPIRRLRRDEMNDVQRSFLDAAVASGHAAVEDHNRPGAVGAGANPRNVRDGIRMSTALTYLAAARPRRNLEVRSEIVVDRVEVRGSRAVGIRLVGGELIEAGDVVLAAGAYASPAILARSGIGPADHLAALGIQVVAALSGVGENLIDHALVATDLPARHRVTGPRYQALTTLRSPAVGLDAPPDLHLLLAGPFDATSDVSPTGAVFAVVAGLMAPRSKGWVRLRSADPLDRPSIHIGHLTAAEDVDRLVEATLVGRQLARCEPLADCIDGPELTPGPDIADDDQEGLARSVRERVSSYHHPVGTCRMGPDPDDGAVVDSRGRVHGVEGLRVCDASIMPTIPSANTNLPTIMVAERISAWLREA